MTGKGLSWCAYFPNDRAQAMMTLEDIRKRDAELCAEIERLTKELEIWKRNGGDILLRAEIERLRIPICIGKPIIQILAKKGAWQSENGNAVIAADELFHNDPYAEIERLRAALTGAEVVMMIVEPRSHKAEYLAALAAVRAALEPKP